MTAGTNRNVTIVTLLSEISVHSAVSTAGTVDSGEVQHGLYS